MGCDGCELWPTNLVLKIRMVKELRAQFPLADPTHLRNIVEQAMGDDVATILWKRKEAIIWTIVEALWDGTKGGASKRRVIKKVLIAFKEAFKCYAGRLHFVRGGRKGYAPIFEQVTEFPGRVLAVSKASDLQGQRRADKSWLNGARRLIFVSDMGDALSDGISNEYLLKEIIEVVSSPAGSRHIWLWLTKRPKKMADFSEWLVKKGINWPDNLVAMTSVTSSATLARIDRLKEVKARYKGLSVEPLWGPIIPNLDGIDWCIVGGESGPSAQPFDLDWARTLRTQCSRSGTAFFVKQLGAAPVENGKPLDLIDGHGGDWNEWPVDLQLRAIPNGFY